MSSYVKLSHQELFNLHKELEIFVATRVANMDNNESARIARFERCNTHGTHMTCVVDGCNSFDFHEQNKELERRYGSGARLYAERKADGTGMYLRIMAPIEFPRSKMSHQKRDTSAPNIQTPILLLLLDVGLAAILYHQVTTTLLI